MPSATAICSPVRMDDALSLILFVMDETTAEPEMPVMKSSVGIVYVRARLQAYISAYVIKGRCI